MSEIWAGAISTLAGALAMVLLAIAQWIRAKAAHEEAETRAHEREIETKKDDDMEDPA